MKVRKRPVEVEAVQWLGTSESYEEIEALNTSGDRGITHKTSTGALFIRTLEGSMEAGITDWIIRGVNGEIYPCKDDIFRKTYEILGIHGISESQGDLYDLLDPDLFSLPSPLTLMLLLVLAVYLVCLII